MGERAGNANLGEVALTLRALYGVESNLRLDRIRDVSARVRELSGYELEPWKPVTGETLYRRETGAVASQFHDPQSIEPYSSELVATERSIVLGKKSGLDSIRIKADELGLDVPEERRAEVLAAVKQLGDARSAASSPTTSSGSSLAELRRDRRRLRRQRPRVRARCSRRAAGDVCVLERNDWFGGAIKTAEITVPGFKHDVFSAWHPLWVGGAAHAQLGDELARARPRVPEHRPADGDRVPGRRERVSAAHGRGQRRRSSGAEWGPMLDGFFPNADLAFGVLGTELWSRHGAALGLKAVRRLGRDGAPRLRRPAAHLGARLARGDVRIASARTACSRRGCCTPASGRTRRRRATWRR